LSVSSLKAVVLFSGGKDSSLALLWAINRRLKIEALVSIIPYREDSYMFHVPNVKLTELQAKAARLPYISFPSYGLKEEEVLELEKLLEKIDVDVVVSGVISSVYQKNRISEVCAKLGLESLTPLWHANETLLLLNLVNSGFDVKFSGVYALGFTRNWLGRKLDHSVIADLILLKKRYGISIAGEGGEYETVVLDAPFFKSRIVIIESETCWDGSRGQFLIKKAELMEKRSVEK